MKWKKPFLLALSILTVSALTLTGCGKQAPAPQEPTVHQEEPQEEAQTGTQTETQEPSEPETQPVRADSLLSVANLLGKPDADVQDLFDGGTENKTEDGSVLLGRTYSTTLDGTAVTLETVYDDQGKVSAVSASFPDQTADEVKAIMTDAFGEPTAQDETQAMDSKYLTWTQDEVSIVMNESYGMAIVEFTQTIG